MRSPAASSPGTASAASDARLRARRRAKRACGHCAQRLRPPSRRTELTCCSAPDPSLWDGRFANNPWLQELPRPLTKLVWDNPLLIAPALAKRMRARKRGSCAFGDRRGECSGARLDHAGAGIPTASRRCLAPGVALPAPSAMAVGSTTIRSPA